MFNWNCLIWSRICDVIFFVKIWLFQFWSFFWLKHPVVVNLWTSSFFQTSNPLTGHLLRASFSETLLWLQTRCDTWWPFSSFFATFVRVMCWFVKEIKWKILTCLMTIFHHRMTQHALIISVNHKINERVSKNRLSKFFGNCRKNALDFCCG